MAMLLFNLLLVASATLDTCTFGEGKADEQAKLTCNPPHAVGKGSVQLSTAAQQPEPTSIDAQLFSYYAERPARSSGRRVRVAALALGADGGCGVFGTNATIPKTAAEGTQRIYDYLHHAGSLKVDLAVLPEDAFGDPTYPKNCYREAEPINGATVRSVQAIAKQYSMNIVLPIHEARGEKRYNTAVVIDRQGDIVGTYSKVFPTWGAPGQAVPPTLPAEVTPPDSVVPSSDGVKSFDLDFGRIAVLICFDINFAELWHQADALGTELLVWPSAMAMPDPTVYGYARVYRSFDIVGVGYPADFVGRDGKPIERSTPDPERYPFLKVATIDLDRTTVHWDYNVANVRKLVAEHPSVVIDEEGPPHFLLRSTDSETSVRALLEQYGIQTLRQYVQRARNGLNAWRRLA